ncbi:MAG: M48 family metallopeptidase [Alphaproteobacteria bacterium]|jgi:heat shock protein HtpX|nr:M48 family metallopeptidase [Alphaproteobacteria bacterium]MBU2041086.1 M48 family metallopeptidase [Alphaproteobacteria bacterium]MBU2125708.1 M48 family metallopeptidase [Alphaproteobacteria bacterium]MBU2209200.1 M48 family metallopeptidase [Alphaproteobacteria bacterium]MBU2396524.1 M48 family metallopeptidase [Alphaproteobacteria bacterium]
MGAVGLQTHIWANNTRSILLLAAFPVLMIFIIYGIQLVMMGFGVLPGTGRGLGDDMALAASWLGATVPLAFIVAGIWFAISYFGSQAMIDLMTGARKVERKSEPDLYNLLENLAISRGLRTPTLRVIDNDSLNAFATGLHEGQYSVTVTRGLVNTLTRDELEAVLAHELTHVINKDVRTMVIASIFAGIISVIAELVFRGLIYSRGGGRRDNKNAMPLILIGLAFAAVGFALAIVIRMMLSRTREYVADAGAVELTKNPDAMISALRKVEGRSSLKGPDELQQLFLDNQPDGVGLEGLFASHPPIQKRIDALVKFGGGVDPGVWSGEPAGAPEGYATSVPAAG